MDLFRRLRRNVSDPATDRPAESEAAQDGDENDNVAGRNSMEADLPLEDEAEDRLDRQPFASAVADTIARRSDRAPIVIGIYGPWGDGKSTVLNWIRRRLDTPDSQLVVLPFNPWLIRDEWTLLPVFFATLATAVGRRMGGASGRIGDVLKKYGGILSGVSFGAPGISVDPGRTVEAVGAALGNRTLEDLKTEFETLLRQEGRRVLVIIDDVDRLDDAEIHAVFKLVKLAGAFEGVTYLMAFDAEKVAAALAKRYATTAGGSDGGYDFLEKIVQVPLRLPRARKSALDGIALEGLQKALDAAGIDIADRDASEFRMRYSQGLSPAVTSIRIAKRFTNAVTFALPLLKGEANAGDVLTIEGINACYPTIYNAVRDHPDWFLLTKDLQLGNRDEELRTRQRERMESILASIESGLRDAAREVIQRTFPQTAALWSTYGVGNERDEWAEQQRVCSPEYFDRYFSYAVSASEVGDQELSEVLADPETLDQRLSTIAERLGQARIEVLLNSLERRLEQLDAHTVIALIRSLVSGGPEVSKDRVPRFFELNQSERTARLIAQLLLQIPDATTRKDAAEEVVRSAHPIVFAAECLRWMRLKKSSTDDRRPLEDDDIAQLQKTLADRVAEHAATSDLPIWQEDGGVGLMYRANEGGRQEEMRQHSSKWLAQDASVIGSLLASVAGVAYGSMGVTQQDLTTDKYRYLFDIANIDDVRAAVRAVRNDAPAPTDFPSLGYERVSADNAVTQIVDQFAWQDQTAAEPPSAQGSPQRESRGKKSA